MDQPQTIKKPTRSVAELAAAHAKAHKRLTIVETVGTILLVFFLLVALASWAFYQQTTKTTSQPYSSNEYK